MDENLLKDYSRAILESSPEAIVVVNGEGLVILASPSVSTVLGYDPDDLLGLEFSLLVAHEDLEAFQQAVRQSRQTQSPGLCSHRFRHGTGRGVSLETAICTIGSDSGAGLVILHSRDMSLRAKIEEQLRLFSSAVEQVDEAMVLTDKDGVIQYVNRAFEVITGYSRDEAVGRTPRILKSGRHDAAHYENLWATVLSGASYHGVVINMRKDGTTYHEDKTITPVKNEAGEVTHFISTGTDVTRQKLAEEKLIEGTERYALSVRGANDGMWDWDFRIGHVYLSHRWKTMLGYDTDEVGDHPEDWFRLVHPDDLAELKTQIKAHVAGSSPHLEHEHRMRQRDGSYAWVLTRGQAVRDGEGKAYRIAGSMTDITFRKRAEEQLQHDALHDALTGLPNRTLFMDRLTQACHRARRKGEKRFAVMFSDLDRFKLINDSLGHLAGDQLLKEVAARIRSCLRATDTVARLGGDEFAILLEEISTDLEATVFAERILQQLAQPFLIEGREVFCTASIGISLFNENCPGPDGIVRDADAAMYHAKERGRSRFALFDSAMQSRALEVLELETDLRRALADNGLKVHYQPIVTLATGRIAGFEALVRWPHPSRGLLPPGDFIPIAEENGLIYSLGLFVLRESCRHLRVLQSQFHSSPPLTMSVNLSGLQFLRPELVGHLDLILKEFGLDPKTLKLEITESSLISHAEHAQKMMAQFKAQQIGLVLDDFGTGYSSLVNLRRYPVDTIKVDQSFVKSMLQDEQSRELVRTTISMAAGLKMDVVAEGVETEAQARVLKEMRCDFGQGYYFSRAVDEPGTAELLSKGSFS